jgi:hypothetical protein
VGGTRFASPSSSRQNAFNHPEKVSFYKFITLNKFFAFLIPNQMHS